METKSSTGMKENLAGLLCYVLGWITGLIFFIIEKESKFVKFHALQSLLFFGGIFVASLVLGMVPILGWLISFILFVLAIIFWIIGMIKAYNNQQYKFPVVGDIAEKQIFE
ncbi:MAG: DUF4870 domain-containing protein [Candidatus Mcinerneyibacterium aminivorans]|uniref:DUF4870 domain-containing protein n=1 Tax=Candidatus Mcinerneyibacterium aminivorans TaxID=2703815 RepID=A0A5D0MGC7_9BACT|nr:MAG: DUF4870 domain-containing protein [Candidatus Mcinerneyibacterium aminivorans]